MAGYQFIHVDNFGLKARLPRISKDGSTDVGKRSARAVLSEADRVPGHSPHVKNPLQPAVIHGIRPLEVLARLEQGAVRARDPLGRKLRDNVNLLLAGVVSYPVPLAVLKRDRESQARCTIWSQDVVCCLSKEFGGQLLSVVRHIDESYLHLHFYCIPDFSAGQCNLDVIHPGRRASASAARKSDRSADARKARSEAYKAAMRDLQDRFFATVSMHHGHARLGPKKRRVPRAQWRAEQAQAEAIERARKEAEHILESARSTLRFATDQKNQTAAEVREMKETAAQDIQRYLRKLATLTKLLRSWVSWMEKRSIEVPRKAHEVLTLVDRSIDH